MHQSRFELSTYRLHVQNVTVTPNPSFHSPLLLFIHYFLHPHVYLFCFVLFPSFWCLESQNIQFHGVKLLQGQIFINSPRFAIQKTSELLTHDLAFTRLTEKNSELICIHVNPFVTHCIPLPNSVSGTHTLRCIYSVRFFCYLHDFLFYHPHGWHDPVSIATGVGVT